MFDTVKSSFYLVVRHRQNPVPTRKNWWLDENRLQRITTTRLIAEKCQELMENGEPVRVHRTQFGSYKPAICCECKVVDVKLDPNGETATVEFDNWKVLSLQPLASPARGQSCYEA